MKQIPLTQGQFAIVDDDDFKELSKHKWFAIWCSDTKSYYAGRNSLPVRGRRRMIQMHRLLLGAKQSELVDHRNHDTLDNRRENIRLCNRSQNNANRRVLQKNNTSGYKGVSWYKRYQKWLASIRVNGKCFHLGYFPTKEEAARAYNEAAIQHFGEFASLNAIKEMAA